MGRSTSSFIFAAAVGFLGGCNRDAPKAAKDKPTAEKATSAEQPADETPVAADGALAPAQITMTEPGSHFTLWRFEPATQSRTVELVMRSAIGFEMGGTKLPKMVMPPLRSTFTSSLAAQDGQFRLGFETQSMEVLDDPQANQEVAAGLKHIIAGVDDLEGFVMLDDRGLATRASFEVSKASSEQLEQSIQSMRQALTRLVVPLPEEAVGVGGEWTASFDDQWLGATVKQTTTYKVLSIDDDVISLAIELEMNANAQDFDFPLVPEGQTIRLTSLSGSGQGHAKFRLDRFMPIEMLTAMNTDLALSVSDERGQTQESRFQVELGLEIRDKTKPAEPTVQPGAPAPGAEGDAKAPRPNPATPTKQPQQPQPQSPP